ncbi:MAG TPA: hypothetical protein VGS41_14200, partial [Chthonomonadales bacterium]|nr:hypothetical protein [Chthonomonadales bacterium]
YQNQNNNNGNGPSDTEDNVEVTFDPFCSHQWGEESRFSLNAIGTPSAKLGGGRANKVEWEGEWQGAVKRMPDGWTAEMKIPWAALSYPASHGPMVMNINFIRFQERTQIQSVWSDFGPQGFLEMDGRWTGVSVPPADFHPTLSLLPYTLTTTRDISPGFRGGLDARFTPTPELTAVGTINPDFATIEGALASIQFTRSQPFVPETRPFFLEGQNLFRGGNFNTIGSYFYSNQIPGFDVGAKLYGKLTPIDTIATLQTIDLGARSDFAARYRHDFSPTSNGGLYLLQKSARDDNNSVAVATQDARWGKLELSSDWALSSGHLSGGDAKEADILYEDKLDFVGLGVAQVSPLFRDADGLIPFTGFYGLFPIAQWGALWRKGHWRAFNVFAFPSYQWHTDGRPFQRGGNIDVNFTTRQDLNLDFNANYNAYDSQIDNTYGFGFTTNSSNRFRQWGLSLSVGRQADRPSFFISPIFSFRIFRKLDLSYAGAIQNLNGVSHQHILSINYQISPTRSIGGRIVVQNAGFNPYFFLQKSGAAGVNYYLIIGDPNAIRFSRQIAFKVVKPL